MSGFVPIFKMFPADYENFPQYERRAETGKIPPETNLQECRIIDDTINKLSILCNGNKKEYPRNMIIE